VAFSAVRVVARVDQAVFLAAHRVHLPPSRVVCSVEAQLLLAQQHQLSAAASVSKRRREMRQSQLEACLVELLLAERQHRPHHHLVDLVRQAVSL
jgi:hypothetical protein